MDNNRSRAATDDSDICRLQRPYVVHLGARQLIQYTTSSDFPLFRQPSAAPATTTTGQVTASCGFNIYNYIILGGIFS
ncbi:hypothetical protein OPQ81_002014 [Rhizoctonia solani]|nr:hypothetical protein OPQ81_002014 [Rhizoctonia solani]